MARFASGKDAYGISDRSGFRYRLRDMRKEWNGFLVGKDEWEAKHPQLEITRHPPDAEALRDPRPDSRVGSRSGAYFGFERIFNRRFWKQCNNCYRAVSWTNNRRCSKISQRKTI